MLSDKDIKISLENNEIEISPLDEAYIQPSSIDLRVGDEFRVFDVKIIIFFLHKIAYDNEVDTCAKTNSDFFTSSTVLF